MPQDRRAHGDVAWLNAMPVRRLSQAADNRSPTRVALRYNRFMGLIIERVDARDWSDEQMEELFSEGFPEFITADRLVKRYIGRIREWFADLNVMLVDEQGTPVATGWGVPIWWDGSVETLPSGYTEAAIRSVENHEQGAELNTLVICGAVVTPSRKGRGLAGETLTALRGLAVDAGWRHVIAPVRPTLKSQYPLASMESFMNWTRPDGTALDPWIRTHQRLGARILTAAPASQTMTGTVSEWEQWTGLAFPESGDYVIPRGLSLLRIDRETDQGVYIEPNVWMQHR
ncbi:hypothetical protein ACL07V_35400 [Streptomyces sp. MB22_4]|uniref:hypothetical protein n=1 Tax=Streptomyces sp. MB22_4 TaxID=3383120 RepID=UPI0039A09331